MSDIRTITLPNGVTYNIKDDMVRNQLVAEDATVNDALSYVNYGYDIPFELAETPDGSWNRITGIKRDGQLVTLNKSTTSSTNIFIRLDGEVQFAGSTSQMAGLTNGFTLKAGHQYCATATFLSGTVSQQTGDWTYPYVRVGKIGVSSAISSTVEDVKKQKQKTTFIAEDNCTYYMGLYLAKNGWVFNNAKILVTLEDLDEGKVALKENCGGYIEIKQNYVTKTYWDVSGTTAVRTTTTVSSWITLDPIIVKPGQKFMVTAIQGNTDKTRIWTVTDESFNILTKANGHKSSSESYTEEFSVPTNGKYLLINTYGLDTESIKKYYTAWSLATEKLLENKTVAIIGDSISTNGNDGPDANVPEITITEADIGVELSAYPTYNDVQNGLTIGGNTFTSSDIGYERTFTPVAEDVGKSIGLSDNYNDNDVPVWWEIAKEELGFEAIPVCYKAASITSHNDHELERTGSYAWHPSQIRKCGIRIPGTMTRIAPDMIIIYRGITDFSRNKYAVLTNDYFSGYDWNYPTSDVLSGTGAGDPNATFGYLEGLALTIKKLREAYPRAKIFLCTLNVFKRISYDHFPTNNGINSLPEYNDAIRKAANFFGCGLIEFDKDGITFENCYSEGYLTDSPTIPSFPSIKGHYVMGQKAITDIKAQYNKDIVY